MRKFRWTKRILPFVIVVGLYLLGPAPESAVFRDNYPVVPREAGQLEAYVMRQEARHTLKTDNEARIIWRDSARTKSEYAVVYLHGFSASQKEGDPVHRRFARDFGCNLFLARLSDHGIDTTEALLNFTAERAWQSACEALAIGEQLGEKVILMSTSTGGTLALMLAARYPDRVHALINLSPNIAINDPAAFLLNDPWGLQIARMVMAGKYRDTGATAQESAYWNARYRLEALVQLEELVEAAMTEETFRQITQPSLTLYYYKNAEEQDPQVKVSAMLWMHEALQTPDEQKKAVAIPHAEAHVIGSSLTSKDVEGVYAEIASFAVDVLRMGQNAAVAARQ